MNRISILDCTLRDGGYVNNNTFGKKNIEKIIKYLNIAGIDIIEYGYLMDKIEYDENKTEFLNTEQAIEILPPNSEYTLMLLGEEYQIENLPKCTNDINNIIRMSFHKKNIDKAIDYSKKIINKGYRLYLQPTVIMSYTEKEIIDLIKKVNQLDIECFSIVDTFGQMSSSDIIEKTKIVEKYLRDDIKIGIHLHNNMQTAYANAIVFLDNVSKNRNVIIDTSLLGMGRGAGNLPTELLANFLNTRYQKNYNIEALVEVSDDIISKIKNDYEWGYSLPYYLSAINGVHPSYIIHFLERRTLNSIDINNLIKMIPEDKKDEYDKEFAEELYQIYNDKRIDDTIAKTKFKKLITNKKIVLLGPGKSTIDYRETIENLLAQDDVFSIAINGNELHYTDSTFYSNRKRYEESHKKDNLIILTSNIKTHADDDELIFDYNTSLSRKYGVSDNALLIMLNILQQNGISEIILVGFDGFSVDNHNNYYSYEKMNNLDKDFINRLNELTTRNIAEYSKKMKIKSITPTKYMK